MLLFDVLYQVLGASLVGRALYFSFFFFFISDLNYIIDGAFLLFDNAL